MPSPVSTARTTESNYHQSRRTTEAEDAMQEAKLTDRHGTDENGNIAPDGSPRSDTSTRRPPHSPIQSRRNDVTEADQGLAEKSEATPASAARDNADKDSRQGSAREPSPKESSPAPTVRQRPGLENQLEAWAAAMHPAMAAGGAARAPQSVISSQAREQSQKEHVALQQAAAARQHATESQGGKSALRDDTRTLPASNQLHAGDDGMAGSEVQDMARQQQQFQLRHQHRSLSVMQQQQLAHLQRITEEQYNAFTPQQQQQYQAMAAHQHQLQQQLRHIEQQIRADVQQQQAAQAGVQPGDEPRPAFESTSATGDAPSNAPSGTAQASINNIENFLARRRRQPVETFLALSAARRAEEVRKGVEESSPGGQLGRSKSTEGRRRAKPSSSRRLGSSGRSQARGSEAGTPSRKAFLPRIGQ